MTSDAGTDAGVLRSILLLAALVGACADDDGAAAQASSGQETIDGASTGVDSNGELPSMEDCEAYLDCLAVAAPSELPDAQQYYGPDGSCWQDAPRPQRCVDECLSGLEQWHEAFPDEPRCVRPGAGDIGDVGEMYLFAISLNFEPETPLQFLATFATDTAGITSLTLQPLTLDVQSVTSPREPFGEPLELTDIPVVEDRFELELGTQLIAGPTNPVTGAEITIEEVSIAGRIDADGFICGTVGGMVTDPLFLALDGSTFAAVRVDSPSMLPVEVSLGCTRDTVGG